MSHAHQSTSLGWRTAQTIQRLSQWVEFQLSRVDVPTPRLGLPDWPWLLSFLQGLTWVVGVMLVLGLAWGVYQRLSTYLQQRQANPVLAPTSVASGPPLQRAQQYWQQAQDLAAQGNYGAACQTLYLATLTTLDDRQQVPHQRSRTGREYLQRLAALPQWEATRLRPYQLLMRTHERLIFGAATATAETYQRCRRAYEEIRK